MKSPFEKAGFMRYLTLRDFLPSLFFFVFKEIITFQVIESLVRQTFYHFLFVLNTSKMFLW